jgi:peptide/nickel transport system substrate-binding protein
MQRRTFLTSAAATSVAGPLLLSPTVVSAQSRTRVLKFIPESDVTVIDPIWTTATVTRNHGYLVFDTLYGQDDAFAMQPQMVAGHTVEDDGKLWRLTLRDGLKFHDGEKVRAHDVVPSIRRFAARDAFGRALMDATDELSAVSDTVVQFRLRHPFPLLPNALGKSGTIMPAIMPERLALTDPNKQVTDMIGSGPFRFNKDERVVGARVVYDRFDGYIPRADGHSAFTAGPKRALIDRVEWHVIPDSQTSASALISGEVEWWQDPTADLLPELKARQQLRIELQDPAGGIGILRFNHLYPPFDNPAIRRALLGAVDQTEFMTAAGGDDRSLWKDHVGVFSPGTPLANDAGIDVLTGKRDLPAVARALRDAGYNGERIVVLGASDQVTSYALALVAVDMLKRVGMNVDFITSDWGTVVQRRASKAPPDKGGWNIFFTYLNGTNNFDPASQLGIRGNGKDAWFGWPTAPKIEALRQAWFEARDLAEQKRICIELQTQFWIDVPYIPLGVLYTPTAYYRRLSGVRSGFPQFYDVSMA